MKIFKNKKDGRLYNIYRVTTGKMGGWMPTTYYEAVDLWDHLRKPRKLRDFHIDENGIEKTEKFKDYIHVSTR